MMPVTVSDLSQLAAYLPPVILRKHICAKIANTVFKTYRSLAQRSL